MRLNAFFPTRDIGSEPAKIRDWAQAAEDLGYAGIEVADHVFGATARDGWTPLYNEKDPFHETFVTLGFLAAVTSTIRLSSGVLILPQRQTGLVAKQAAEADILCGGRLRLGVGVGWNFVEYQALGMDWNTRGARQAEQIEVLRRLWTDVVTFRGRQHHSGADPAPDPDLARRLVGCRGQARGPARRRLDADHGARRGGAEDRGAAPAPQGFGPRPRELRDRGLAAHARG
jgi:alkanesulfonate monooxygenase SsuD/methylene tetrahydromethanopterin reductase-like flavin-dependent oxidoreductase (luciferase family)